MTSDDIHTYKPKHHHLDRRHGSSTGGISQIFFGELENVAPPSAAESHKGRGAGSHSFISERNRHSSIFDCDAQDERKAGGRARVATSIASSTMNLGHESVFAPSEPTERPQTAQRNNPILGGAFDSMSSREEAPLERPSTSHSMRDPNRPSVIGGIFGTDSAEQATSRFTPRRHMVSERAAAPQFGSKRFVNGRVEYCA